MVQVEVAQVEETVLDQVLVRQILEAAVAARTHQVVQAEAQVL